MKHTSSLLIFALLLAPAAPGAADHEEGGRETKIKAAFLYHVMKFVEWPAGTFDEKKIPIVLAVIGYDHRKSVAAAFKGKTVHGREIRIRSSHFR